MDMITVTAKTVDEAVTKALIELETTSDKLEYEVVEKGSAGFLGIGAKPAIIRAKKKETLEDRAIDFLSQVFDAMNLDVKIAAAFNEEECEMNIDLSGEDMGILIGKSGITLDSLQYLVSLVINRNTEDYMKVKLDTENYRERRKETLENLAHNLAHKVKRIHRPVYLEPMNPYERRVIHSALQKDKYVETHSEGDEPYRKVVITLKPGVDTGYERRGKYSYGNSRYGKRNNGGYRKKYNNSYQKKYDEYEKDSSEDVQDNE
jgi:spoIIIJ-associated protein